MASKLLIEDMMARNFQFNLNLNFYVVKMFLCAVAILALANCAQEDKTPQEACNFVQNKYDQRVSWKGNLPIRFRIHTSVPKDAYESIEEAAKRWNSISTQRVIEIVSYDSKTPFNKGFADGTPTVYWVKSGWDKKRPKEQARTTIFWANRQIRDADIRINNEKFDFTYKEDKEVETTKVDLISLMVHEFGHALGMAHISRKTSVMYALLSRGLDRRAINQKVDISSYQCEYGEQIVKTSVVSAAIDTTEFPKKESEAAEPESEETEEVAEINIEVPDNSASKSSKSAKNKVF